MCLQTGEYWGSIIAGAFSVVTALFLSIRWLYGKYRLGNPLDLQFSLDPYELPIGKQYRDQKAHFNTGLGKHSILLRILPKRGTDFSRIGVRFVKRRWLFRATAPDGKHHFIIHNREGRLRLLWDWDNVSTDSIVIHRMYDVEMEHLKTKHDMVTNKLREWDDHCGGRWGQYEPLYTRTKEDSLWIGIDIEAKASFNGHLSFQGSGIDKDHRAYKRRSIVIN